MALVHVVVLYGTNNVEWGVGDDGLGKGMLIGNEEIRRREVGSRLVLLSRVFYALRYVLLLSCF